MHRDPSLMALATPQAQAMAAADGTSDIDGTASEIFEALRSLDPEDRERRVALIDRMLSLASSTNLADLGQ